MNKIILGAGEVLENFFSLFFPRYCLGCGEPLTKGEEMLCTFCLFHLPRTYFHQDPGNPAARVFWGRVHLEMASSFVFFHKGGNVQELLHQLKYQGKKEIGLFLGRQYAFELGDATNYRDVDAIIPVPLHPKKLRKRGYNQSQYFAEGLSEEWKIPVERDCLFRRTYSSTQTRKSRYERWENVEDIFGISNPETISGKHILLVDDVITTGATLEACASVLLNVENTKVSALSIAFAAE
jgi:ComF family protein